MVSLELRGEVIKGVSHMALRSGGGHRVLLGRVAQSRGEAPMAGAEDAGMLLRFCGKAAAESAQEAPPPGFKPNRDQSIHLRQRNSSDGLAGCVRAAELFMAWRGFSPWACRASTFTDTVTGSALRKTNFFLYIFFFF